jgi:plasmid maintenance system antidote protein VapI
MYIFKQELKKELLNGMTIRYIANTIGVTEGYISQVLNGKKECSKLVAYCLCKIFNYDLEVEDCFERVD